MNALQELITLAPPPPTPFGVPFDWPAIESELGTALPADYKAYCDTYGHGGFFAGWRLSPLTPHAPSDYDDLAGTFWRDVLAEDPLNTTQRPFPEPGGVLPFASNEWKHTYWWQTGGPPDAWPVLIEDDGGEWTQLEQTATDLLAAFVRGDEPDEDYPRDFYPSAPVVPGVIRPSVIVNYGLVDGDWTVVTDLGGAFKEPRQGLLDAFLASASWKLRAAILDAEALRSREVIHLRGRAGIDPVREAVQAWANERAGYRAG